MDILLRCSKCGLCVHRFCYGVTEYSTPWLCYACSAKQKYPTCIVCMLVFCFGERLCIVDIWPSNSCGRPWMVSCYMRWTNIRCSLYQQQQDHCIFFRRSAVEWNPVAWDRSIPGPANCLVSHLSDTPFTDCLSPFYATLVFASNHMFDLPATDYRSLCTLLLREVRFPRPSGVSRSEQWEEVELYCGSSCWCYPSVSHIVPMQHGAHHMQPTQFRFLAGSFLPHPQLPPNFNSLLPVLRTCAAFVDAQR